MLEADRPTVNKILEILGVPPETAKLVYAFDVKWDVDSALAADIRWYPNVGKRIEVSDGDSSREGVEFGTAGDGGASVRRGGS